MKKIMFLQIKGNSLGGIWFVNKTLGEKFIDLGYDVRVLGLRNNHPGIEIKDTLLKIDVINEDDIWEITRKRDILDAFGKKGFFKVVKKYITDQQKLNLDYEKMKDIINDYNPDYIFATHYQTLNGIPDKFLSKTIFVQHSSFAYLLRDRNNIKTLKQLNDKIHGFYWLSKSTYDEALKFGFKKNHFIYNPIKFIADKKADVVNNKKIVVVTRIHAEKRIDLMVEIVNDIFSDDKFKDWTFDVYGIGTFNERSKEILDNSKQIFYKGLSENPMDVLLNGSLTLNTSEYEGFSLSIIEGFECGLPVIAFNFGEAAHEQVIDDYNGYIVNDVNEFKERLISVMSDSDVLEKLSNGAREFAAKFEIDNVVREWEKIFLEIDKDV